MSYFGIFLFILNIVNGEWIKLPEISPDSVSDVPKIVFKLAPPPAVMSSEMMSSVFSFNPSTEATIITENISTRKSYTKKYFQSTVTSKVINFMSNISDLITSDEFMEPVKVVVTPVVKKKKETGRVAYFNKTVAMNVSPIFVIKDEEKIIQNDDSHDEDDDGVTIVDEPDEYFNNNDEYYYYDDEEETTKFHSLKKSTTTTEMPKKAHKKISPQHKIERRINDVLRAEPMKPFADMNFPSFINFLRKIQASFAIRTAKTIGDKIKMLLTFRDSLMSSINKQIKRLWRVQPRLKKKSRRMKRTLGGGGLMEHSPSAMDFPSAEGALLSICFLTFAVFLIKLVLQVIHTIKMKKAMWMTTQMMSTENVVIKRQKRDEEYENVAKILDSIESLKV